MSRYIALGNRLLKDLPDDKSLFDTRGELKIELLSADNSLSVVRFEDFVAYRKLDEGDAYRVLRSISTTSEIGHLLYLVEDSEFIEWFSLENHSVRDRTGMKHFCITTFNSIIDVISFSDPISDS